MSLSTRRCFLTLTGIVFLWLFMVLNIPKEIEDDQNVYVLPLSMPQGDSYGYTKKLRPQEDWQSLTSAHMEKIQKRKKTWLTVGITSVSRWDRSSLLYTLTSLYHSSSLEEQKHLTVLIHLADSDLIWLKETISHISRLFGTQILAGKLLLIHAPSDVYPTKDGVPDEARHGKFSKQNIDHAFLMSFATNLSTYFLLIEDDVFCAPNFITHIHSKVTTLKSDTWALLEFSNMGLLGKLFHNRDLPRLARFLLLFHKDKPLDRLILHFRTLMVQENPILYKPFLFYHRISHPTFDDQEEDTVVQEKDPNGPDNPSGAVFTDMKVYDVHLPWEAYTLDESFFWTYNVLEGNHLTVILNHSANLTRVQVMTGSIVDGKYVLEKGHVELGYNPEGMPQYCTSFAMLGRLIEGQLYQEIFPKSKGYHVSCVKLVVNARQAGGLMIRHIYLWKEKADQSQ